jgi:LPXTG-motif cell wall-anchored protein
MSSPGAMGASLGRDASRSTFATPVATGGAVQFIQATPLGRRRTCSSWGKTVTTSSSRERTPRLQPVVRLVRMVLSLAIAFLTVPFLTLAPAYADDSATASGDVTTTEVVDPPPGSTADQPPADQPAAQEPAPAPAAQEAPAPEQPADTTPPATTTGDGGTTSGTSSSDTSGKPAQKLSATADAALPDPACKVSDFDQNTLESGGGTWLNGALNQQNSNYSEGDLVPQRVELGGLVPGTYTLGFTFDRTKSHHYAYDYVADLGISGSTGASATWASTTDPAGFDGPAPLFTNVDTYTVAVTITFTITAATDPTATLFWAGHIASELDYGPGSGAGSISGAPYHFSLTSTSGTWGCDAGKRDNQLMADAVDAGTITIVKDAQPNAAQDFNFTLAAPNGLDAAFQLDDDSDATLPNSVTYHVPPGTTTASEVNLPDGWNLTGISCTKAVTRSGASVSVILADDEAVTCTFTNSRTSTLEVDKYWVINGGTPVQEGDEPSGLGLGAQLTVDGANQPWNNALNGYLQGTSVSLNESVTFGNDLCDWAGTTHGSVTEVNGSAPDSTTLPHALALGGGANHATITNEVTCAGALVLKKVVTNTNGGTAVPGDFTLVASPAGGGADLTTQGSTGGHSLTVTPGTVYDLSEKDGPAHYSLTGINCGGTDPVTSISVPAGETRTCTFTNHDSPGSLTLVKEVNHNGTGDTTAATAWTLSATATSGGGATITGTTGVKGDTKAGAYSLAESNGPAAFTPSAWTCLAGATPVTVTAGSVAVAMGQDVTCTITNTAIAPHLTLVKIVDPLDTGDLTDASAFTLTATPDIDARPVVSGPGPVVSHDVFVGSYTLSESGPVGYEANGDGWVCVDASQDAVALTGTGKDTLALAVGDDVTCTITNVAVPATVEVDKYWSVNGGPRVLDGDLSEAGLDHLGLDAQLSVNGTDHAWDTTIGGFLRGAPVTLDEDVTIDNRLCRETGSDVIESHGAVVPDGDGHLAWHTTAWAGTNHYTILNTVECASELTLDKVVDHGKTGDDTTADAFTLTADATLAGEPTLSGKGHASSAVTEGDFVLSESGPSTYEADAAGWVCKAGDDTLDLSDSTVTVPLATSVTCTIVNHAIPSLWKVSKTSDPVSGSTVKPGDQIDYTVTLTKVGTGVPVRDFDVTDTLTGVEDGWVSGLEDEGATIHDGKITWHIAELDGVLTLTYTVTVGDNAWNSEIDNVVTEGPVPCTDVNGVECDHTEHFTPHYVLDKDVALLDEPGDGDNLAEPGEHLKYTLTVTNDSDAIVDTVISDNVADVVDNAEIVSLGDNLSYDEAAGTLSWTVAGLEPGKTIKVSYVVEINAGAWGVTLHNVATPSPEDGGECVPAGDLPGGTDDNGQCETTTETPPVTTMVVQKQDLESDEVLAGATFQVWSLGPVPEGGCDFSAAPGAEGQVLMGTAVTEADGQALFHDLQHGCYLLVETGAPTGYELPDNPVMGVQVDEQNFVAGGEMAPIVVTDFAEGQLAIVAKRQYERIGGAWVESDGKVDFGDTVRYIVQIAANGPKNFHDVKITDYVPGFNPADTVSTMDGTLVAGSAHCAGTLTCTASDDPATHLVTWSFGDLEPGVGETLSGSAVMDVVFPDPPGDLVLAPEETFSSTLWNVGSLEWDEAVHASDAGQVARLARTGGGAGGQVATAATVVLPTVHHSLLSNEVVVTASMTAPPEKFLPGKTPGKTAPGSALPQTGAPAGLLPMGLAAFVLIGAGLVLTRRRKEDEPTEG